jgi:two-component system cell cycle sensor histidine kinase/response regulator CckA
MNPHGSLAWSPALCSALGVASAAPGAPPGETKGEPPGGPAGAQRRILLVEDDHSIRDALRGILAEEGYAVTTAENGRQALEQLGSGGAPDLIVLDLRMPIMDGWEFRALQKNDPKLAGIPVLAVSADGSAKAAAIDAEAYLRKPLSTDALLGTITRILSDLERRRLLGRLEEAERFAALGRLAASVGHEINNPLAYVAMNVEQAMNEVDRFFGKEPTGSVAGELPSLPASLPTLLRECRVGLDRIRDVVRDLQRLSRQTGARRESFSLADLLDESLAMARNQVEHRARVRKRYAQGLRVHGDRSALGQVLLNLILNAAQALPDGRAEANEVTLTTYARDGQVHVEVADTGAGIPPQILPHIFDPFYTTKPIGEGTGLGLAVSCRIVADHGGRIDVESEVGRGSLFRVVLPAAPVAAGPTLLVESGDPDHTPVRARILVIDDLLAFGRTIARALVEHEVTVVGQAEEAFARLAEDDGYDVILCDVQMPELGARGVCQRLAAAWPHLCARMIFMTGGAFTPEAREFLEQTPQTILTKPFSIDELRAAIDELMDDDTDGRN